MNRHRITELREWMKPREPVSTDGLLAFYRERGEELASSSFYYRLSRLKEEQVLEPVSRGLYRLASQPKMPFKPNVSGGLKRICSSLKKKTLGISCGFWSTEWLQGLVELQRVQHWDFIEPEKGLEEIVYWKLRGEGHNVFLNPSSQELERYAGPGKRIVVVRPLISEAPLAGNGIAAAKIEKILVDLLSDKLLMQAYDRGAREQAFRNAFALYLVSLSTLGNYARRRNRQDELNTMLNVIKPSPPR